MPIGPFQKRAARTISNAALYDLVEDMAKSVDTMALEVSTVNAKLDTVLELLRGKI